MKIVITGSGGRLGAALLREYGGAVSASQSASLKGTARREPRADQHGIGLQPMKKLDLGPESPSHVIGFDHARLDLADLASVRRTLDPLDFDLLVNAAAFTNVDLAEKEKDQAFRINADAPRVLAEICRGKGARLIHFSTDYVFDGEKREPYTEEDPANPISVYGESKRAGEKFVLDAGDQHLVVRVSWVFAPERPSFVDAIIERARKEEHVEAIADKFSAPTYTHDIAEMLPRFFDIRPGYSGILHFANAGACSWQEYAQFALDCCRASGVPLKATKVGAVKLAEMKVWVARRPVYSVLSTEKFTSLTGETPRTWRDAVTDYIEHFYSKK
jgi:dTDP-4-dehydrorhamnose reductase